jgi:hypothetical protein
MRRLPWLEDQHLLKNARAESADEYAIVPTAEPEPSGSHRKRISGFPILKRLTQHVRLAPDDHHDGPTALDYSPHFAERCVHVEAVLDDRQEAIPAMFPISTDL